MAALGENVGRAYVRILADGDGLDESIRRQFQDADGAFDESGRRGSQRYRDAFAREMESRPTQTRLRRSISDALAKGDFLQKDFLNSRNWKEFKNGLQKEFGDAGKLAGERLERELVQGMTFDQLKSKLNNIQPLITRAQDDILKNDRQFIRDRNSAYEEHRRRMAAIVQSLNKEFDQVSRNIDLFGRGDKGAPARANMLDDLERIGREMRSAGGGSDDFVRSLKNQEDRLRRIHPRLTAFDGAMGRFSNTVGKAFGKGSRNDFVNFIGSFVGGVAGALRIIPRAITAFQDFGATISKAMGEAAATEGTGALQVAMAGVTAGLKSGGAALAAFGAAAVGAMFLIGPMVALLSALVGIVTALSGTIVFGLVGGLAALAGAAVPLVGIIGGLVFAFHNLSDAQKKIVKEAFKPLRQEFSGLATAMREPILRNIGDQAQRLAPLVSSLHPLFRRLGQVISGIGDSWLDAIDSQGFRNFRGAMETFLPDAMRNVGHIIGNVFGGLAGIFVAIVPLTESFLGWLRKITTEFARWANDKGRQTLLDFFHRAADSAKSLGGFLLAAGGFLAELLGQGQKTGDNIFDQMAASIRDATQWLEDHPNAVANWFDSAQHVADDIGKLITGLTELVDAFDNADTRIAADVALGTFANLIHGAAVLVQADALLIGGALHGISGAFHAVVGVVSDAVGGIKRAFGNIKDSFKLPRLSGRGPLLIDVRSIAGAMVRGFSNVGPRIAVALASIPGRVRGIFNRIGPAARLAIPGIVRPFAPVVGRIVGLINGLPGRARGVFNRLPGVARSVIGGITRPFAPVVGRIMGFINSLPGRVRGLVNRLPGIARSAANNSASQFRSVPGRIMGLLASIPGRVQGLLGRLAGIARSAASRAVSPFAGVAGRIAGHFSGVGGAVAGRLSGIAGAAQRAASSAVNAFRGLAGRIIGAVGTIHLPTPTISMPHIPKIHIPGLAVGGIENGLRGVGVIRRIAEAGPEAVVPLNRPLSQVDPSVRLLSAIAQGKAIPAMANGGVAGGKTVDVGGITVITTTSDPRAVAAEVFNRFAATAY